MERLFERVAGLDIHKDSVVACVRVPDEQGGRCQQTRGFATTTEALLTLLDWLRSYGITLVGIESTGVYWRPVYYLLEDHMECWLLNAQHLRNVPGRKTDVKDAEWICQLVEHGLVRPSFVPPREIRDLRDLTRYRKTPDRGAHPRGPASGEDAAGRGDQAVLGRLEGARCLREADARGAPAGTHDPEVLADLARGRLRAKLPALREALAGRFTANHALIVSQILAHVDFLDESIAALSDRIDEVIARFRPTARAAHDDPPGLTSAPPSCCWLRSGPTCRASRPPVISPPGQECALARTSPPARPSPARPDTAPSGCARAQRSGQSIQPHQGGPISQPNISDCAVAPATRRPPSPPATRSSSPPGTCSPGAFPTTTSATTTSSDAKPNTPNATDADSSNSARSSATRSPSNHYQRPRERFSTQLPEQLRTPEGRRKFFRQAREQWRRQEERSASTEDLETEVSEEVALEFDPARIVARVQGREGWLREGKRHLERHRWRHPDPIPRARADRLLLAAERLESDLEVERRANASYEDYRATARDKLGRRLSRAPKPYEPPEVPAGRVNITDLDSESLPVSFGFAQGYSAQAAVNEQRIVLAAEITNTSTDFSQLDPMVTATLNELERIGVPELPEAVVADAGYWNEQHIDEVVANKHIPVLIPPDKVSRGTPGRPGAAGATTGCEKS